MNAIDMKKWLYLFVIGLMMTACEQEFPPVLDSVTVDEVKSDGFVCHVDVTSGQVVDCGFYYGTSKNSVANAKSAKVSGVLSGTVIQGTITGLKPNTTYYIMGFAMNEKGQGTTEVLQVKTAALVPGSGDNLYPGTTE